MNLKSFLSTSNLKYLFAQVISLCRILMSFHSYSYAVHQVFLLIRVLLETHTYLCSVDYIILASDIHIAILKELFIVSHFDKMVQDVTKTSNQLMRRYHEINFLPNFSRLICSSLFVFQHSSNQVYVCYL